MIVKEVDVRFYHLKNDLAETTNLAADQPEVAGRMREAIEEFKQTVVPGS